MKKTHLIPTFAALLLAAACTSTETAQEELFALNGTCWTDGYEFFVGQEDTITHDSTLTLFLGGNLHEEGYGFALQRLAADTFLIQTVPGTPTVAVGMVGDTVVLAGSDSLRMLVYYSPDDPETDTLRQFDPGDLSPKEAYGRMLLQKHLDELRGSYTDDKSGTTVQFADTLIIRTRPGKQPDTASFHILYAFDMPTHALALSTGERLWYEKTAKGFDLFTAKEGIDDDYTTQRPLYKLKIEN